eukprot:403347247
MRLKTAATKLQRFKNQYNCGARELFPREQQEQIKQSLIVHKQNLNISYEEQTSDLFITIMLEDAQQCIQNLQQPYDTDLVISYLKNLRQIYEVQPIEMKQNNKFMDLLFTSHSFFVEAIPQSSIYCDLIIEAMISYLEEIAIPFYLNQNFINKDSLFKLTVFMNNKHNKMLLGRFQKVRATIEEKVKQLPQSQDGISLICEMFDQNDLIIKLKDQISDESKTNMRYLYDKIGSQQKQISEQIFEGKVHNYIGHMLQFQEAWDKQDFNGYMYWANELVDLSLKKMDVQMFLDQFILLTNFLCDSGFNEECIKIYLKKDLSLHFNIFKKEQNH